MNHNLTSKLIRNSKMCLKSLFIMSLLFFLTGCDKNNEDEPDNPVTDTANAYYYVKYEATLYSHYGNYQGNVSYSVSTDNGVKLFQGGKSFSQTFGPVKKGFLAFITAKAEGWMPSDYDIKIYVCRGNEPFALKAYTSGSASVAYTIDY